MDPLGSTPIKNVPTSYPSTTSKPSSGSQKAQKVNQFGKSIITSRSDYDVPTKFMDSKLKKQPESHKEVVFTDTGFEISSPEFDPLLARLKNVYSFDSFSFDNSPSLKLIQFNRILDDFFQAEQALLSKN